MAMKNEDNVKCLCKGNPSNNKYSVFSPKLHENISTNTDSLPIGDQCSQRTDITTISSDGGFKISQMSGDIHHHPNAISNDPTYVNGIVPEIIAGHTLERNIPQKPLMFPRSTKKQMVNAMYSLERRPPPPAPLPNSYIEIIDERDIPTLSREISQTSGGYEHVKWNHSRQQSRVSQIDNGYINMNGGINSNTPVKQTNETQTQTGLGSMIRRFRQQMSGTFDDASTTNHQLDKQQTVHSNTVPNPKVLKRKYQRKGSQDNEVELKRTSAKFGTVKFKTLLSKFSKDNSINEEEPAPGIPRRSSALDNL